FCDLPPSARALARARFLRRPRDGRRHVWRMLSAAAMMRPEPGGLPHGLRARRPSTMSPTAQSRRSEVPHGVLQARPGTSISGTWNQYGCQYPFLPPKVVTEGAAMDHERRVQGTG